MKLDTYKDVLRAVQPVGLTGRVSSVRGLTIMVSDFPVPIGAACRISREGLGVEGRVIGFSGDQTMIMPIGSMIGICRGDRVICTAIEQTVAVGNAMLGRVLSGLGEPIDGLGPIQTETRMPLWPKPISPLQRRRITEPLSTGVRAIDSLLTVGQGQRMGIFSGSGVGKSTLLGMISRYTSADVNVIALIGERGREVREFIEKDLGPEGLARSVIIVSTGDEPPLVRVQAGAVAASVAEFFRDRGKNVLLLMDSLTRLATAQRQIGLVAGEPPATKGYTPSVFNLLPELLERSGRTEEGSITGFYTVLVEADEMNDPISDAARSVTDGHIWLSRDLANRGHWPAIDVLQSVSRVMIDIVDAPQLSAASQVRRQMALYSDVEELLNIGAYTSGGNVEHDQAIAAMPAIRSFLCQSIQEKAEFGRTAAELTRICRVNREPKRAVARLSAMPSRANVTVD
jgi:flagellum-specific ATP synthase